MIDQASRNGAQETVHVPNRWCPSRHVWHTHRRSNPIDLKPKKRRSCSYKVRYDSFRSPISWCIIQVPELYIVLAQAAAVAAAAAATLNSGDGTFPNFVPEQVSEIQEEAALNMIRSMVRCKLEVPSLGQPVETAFAEITGDCASRYQSVGHVTHVTSALHFDICKSCPPSGALMSHMHAWAC